MVRYFIVNSSSGGLDGAVHIADRPEQYEIFPKIKTGEDLGHFLVDTAPYLNQLVPMDGITVEDANEMAPCLQRLKKGREMMEEDGVRQTWFGLVRRLGKPFPPAQEPSQQMGGLSC